eukprot:5916182-Pyramimonas_sp.AAC.2
MNWESGVFLGINDKSQELIRGTPKGARKSHECERKGSEEEIWNLEELNAMQGLPWQPDPNTAGMEVQARIIVPMDLPEQELKDPETGPFIARGIAVKRHEYLQMGPTHGCYGCRCLVRGDKDHKPHNAERRARVIEWLKRQENANIQTRSAAAQQRVESKSQVPESPAKRPRVNEPPPQSAKVDDLKDEWVTRGNKVIRQHRTPRTSLYYPTGGDCPVDWGKLSRLG